MTSFLMPLALLVVSIGATEGDAVEVSQRGRAFAPGAVEVARGGSIVIRNNDRFVHHVQVDHPDLKVDSGVQRPGDWLAIEFAKQGIYDVTCDIHPKMLLTVTVK